MCRIRMTAVRKKGGKRRRRFREGRDGTGPAGSLLRKPAISGMCFHAKGDKRTAGVMVSLADGETDEAPDFFPERDKKRKEKGFMAYRFRKRREEEEETGSD